MLCNVSRGIFLVSRREVREKVRFLQGFLLWFLVLWRGIKEKK